MSNEAWFDLYVLLAEVLWLLLLATPVFVGWLAWRAVRRLGQRRCRSRDTATDLHIARAGMRPPDGMSAHNDTAMRSGVMRPLDVRPLADRLDVPTQIIPTLPYALRDSYVEREDLR